MSIRTGYHVNVKRIRRLHNLMGLQTIYRAARTTIRNKSEYIYPYLLKNLVIDKPNDVCQTSITYIPMKKGFMYLKAIVDVYSRKILGWSLFNNMTKEWVCELVETTIEKHDKPEIIYTDLGSQYTSQLFIDLIKGKEIKLSMDGRGRVFDNRTPNSLFSKLNLVS